MSKGWRYEEHECRHDFLRDNFDGIECCSGCGKRYPKPSAPTDHRTRILSAEEVAARKPPKDAGRLSHKNTSIGHKDAGAREWWIIDSLMSGRTWIAESPLNEDHQEITIKRLEARLAESEQELIHQRNCNHDKGEMISDLRDKLSSAEARCKELEAERAKDIEAFKQIRTLNAIAAQAIKEIK